MRIQPIAVIIGGMHYTISEIVQRVQANGLLSEAEVRMEANRLWQKRRHNPLYGSGDDKDDWFTAEKTVALIKFLESKQ